MRLLAGLLLAYGIAAGLGLWLTRFTVEQPLGIASLRTGPWTADPSAGSLRADPYSRAAVARRGDAPIPASDGIAFLARTDSAGADLDGRCDYSVEGKSAGARIWTLSVYDPEGLPIANAADRYAVTSTTAVRPFEGNTAVALAASARPGNWLPSPKDGKYLLALRLYEPTGTISASDPPALPSIRRTACR